MADIYRETGGYFGGRSLVQQGATLGGARHVFYKVSKIKDELVHPTGGGQLMNPFPGAAKLYAGDLFEYRCDDKVENPQIFALKTYKVVSVSGKTVNIERTPYSHKPFVGDVLGVAPNEIGGAMTAQSVVGVAATTTTDGKKVWALTMESALTGAKADDVLVESDADGKMLLKRINAVAPWDYTFQWSEAADPTDENEFEKARYFLTPVLGAEMYIHRMSVMPKCVLDLNISNIQGVFKVDAFYKPFVQTLVDLGIELAAKDGD